jgi:hypothetical protein
MPSASSDSRASSTNDGEPAMRQARRISRVAWSRAARFLARGRPPGSGCSVVLGSIAVKSSPPACAGRRCRRRCTAGWFGSTGDRRAIARPAATRPPCGRAGRPAAVLLGRAVAQLDHRADFPGRPDHHVPGQVRDLAGAQASLQGQQQDQMVSTQISGRGGEDEEAARLLIRKYLGLFSRHNEVQFDVYAAAYSIDNRRSRMMPNMNTCDVCAISSQVLKRRSLAVWGRIILALARPSDSHVRSR